MLGSLRRITTLIKKEILTFWRDKKSRVVLILPPLMQLLIFAFAATLDVKNVPIAIVNNDNGASSIELIQRFIGSSTFKHITFLKSIREADDYIDNQRVSLIVYFDETFSRNIASHLPAEVGLILDGRKSNTAQIIAGYVSQMIEQFNTDLAKKEDVVLQKTALVPRFKFNHNLNYTWYNVPCLSGLLTMMVGLVVTSLSVAREREMGTFDQLLVSPMSPFEILAGKMIPGIVIAMLEGSIIILAAIFLFQIPFTGSFFNLYFCMFFFVIAVTGVGLFLSSLCSTQQQAILGTFIFMTPAVLLSGYATPIENMPHWLQNVTYLNPLRYYILVAKGEFLKAMPFDVVWQNTWPLIIIGLCTASMAAWLFRRRME